MALLALGLNHQTAPLSLRERVAVADAQLAQALRELRAQTGISECALLSTCNRTEIYAQVEPGAEEQPGRWLAQHHGLHYEQIEGYLYRHVDGEAVRHLYRVATGLDSLVLGEPQVLGQVKQAWMLARDGGTLGSSLDRLFQHSFSVAKRVRTDTAIGLHPVSVAYAGVRLAQQAFAALDQATVMLIGAGDTIELAARHLAEQRTRRLLVANRTLAHAQALAEQYRGYALPLSQLDAHLAEADVVISATAAREPILRRPQVEAALRQRRHRPMFLLDLAVPRDIAPEVGELGDVFLYTVDDLEQVIEENRRSRREAADQAETIIDLQVQHFLAWWRGSVRQDPLRRMRERGEAEREAVLTRASQMLAAGKPPEEALRFLAHTLTNKLLHAPSAALREAAQQGDLDLLRAAERLFDTQESPTNEPESQPPAQA
jgi:glutamyl-tRNA reductase